ncbi:MAG TPA: CocE/NonD family hydrolase [Actinomycetota bacterium]|nr:CocE/NonD family hydrolase [Actinomycetota bacterium]
MPVREHAFIPMSDGVRLAASLFLPDGPGPWPAILEALPYRKDDVTATYRPEYERLAEAGYAVCRLDLRGTGSSEGVAEDEYPPQEQKDLLEVIDWLAGREWSTGAVGMYGTSYSGFNSIQVAMEQPPALRAIVPIYATDDRYADDVHYMGGALKALDLVDYPLFMVSMNALPPVPSVFGEGWREEWERRVAANEPWVLRWLEEQTHGPYWQHGSLRPDYHRIRAATMIVAGWADGYRNNSLRTFQALRCPKRLLIGPWAHAATDTSLPGPNIDLVPEMLRWWDRWLKGVDSGVDREPPIVVYVRRSTRPDPLLREVRGGWRFEPTWPAERLRERTYRLADAAGPPGEGPDALDVRGDVGWTAWISCAGHLPYGQPADQRPDEAFSLSYDWGPIGEELEILGHPRLEVTLSSSAPIACLSAKLCDVFPDGASALVTRGLLNLTHRRSRERPEPLVPGRPERVVLELEATSWVFEPGHRIRLDLAGADWPNAWPPPGPGALTVDRGEAALVLPVLEGPPPVAEAPRLAPSTREQESVPPPDAPGGPLVWRIEHDVVAGETRAVIGHGSITEPAGGIPGIVERSDGTVAVSTTDPGRAWCEARYVYRIDFPEASVESEARERFESDARTYRLTLELDVREDGEPRWQRRWERTFPRELQ